MKAFSFLSARIDSAGLFLIAVLAVACSSNDSGLPPSTPPSHDGAPTVLDAGPSSRDGNAASPADAPAPTGADAGTAGTGGAGGSARIGGAGGSGGTGGMPGTAGTGGAPSPASTGGAGGSARIGGAGGSGGTGGAPSLAGTTGTGGVGGVGGIAVVGGITTKPTGGTAGANGGNMGTPDAGPASGTLTIDKVSLTFGSVNVGTTSAALAVAVTNSGSKQVAIMPTITGSMSFRLTDTCVAVPPAGSCPVLVVFAPAAVGSVSGVLSISSALAVSLSGTGVPVSSFSVTGVDLGSKVATGASVTGAVTVTATVAVTDLTCSVSGADLTFDPAKVCPAALAAGTSCTVGFTFKATTSGPKTDSVVCSAAGMTKTAVVTATVFDPPKLAITPLTASFQTQYGTQSAPIVFGVGNAGGLPTGPISVAFAGANPDQFAITVPGCLAPLAGATACSMQVVCKPTSVGTKIATLNVADASGVATSVSAALTCVSLGPATLTVTGTANLGSVAIGSTGTPQTFTVKNTGAVASGTLAVALTDPEFVKSNDTCSGIALAAGATCSVGVSLHPVAAGALTAVLSVTASAGNPASIQVSGIGLPPGP